MSQRYWAFLSYSHADEAAAAKLHRALENYSLPSAVRRAHALPKRLVPVFRDLEELEASPGLAMRLRSALDESRWLVVLCSPAAAKSKYVESEIEYFIGKHGSERILCVLLEGEPAESFPAALRALPDEPLAADLRQGADPQLATLKLIAAMAAVGFTELRNREAQRGRRQRVTTVATAVGLGVTALAAWDLYYRPHVDYYVSYERRHGIWEGIGVLSRDEAAARNLSWRFTRRGRLHPPDEVAFVNGLGGCPNGYELDFESMSDILRTSPDFSEWRNSPRYCSATFEYRPDGAIAGETIRNAVGAPSMTVLYTTPTLAQLTHNGFATASEGGGVRYIQIAYDEAGYMREERFLYSEGQPRANSANAFGYRLAHDAEGRLLTVETLDADGNGIGDGVRYAAYSRFGPARTEFIDADGRPRAPDGYAAALYRYDAAGNRTGFTFEGADGKPAPGGMVASAGDAGAIWQVTMTYDAHGNAISMDYLDAAGRPIAPSLGIGHAEFDREAHGQLAGIHYRTTDGKPTPNGSGASEILYAYDERGLVSEYRYFGVDGKPVESWRGDAMSRFERDVRGNIVRSRYYGKDGKPSMVLTGAEQRRRYDDHDRLLDEAYFDVQGRPATLAVGNATIPVGGFSRRHFDYDERGNAIRMRYFGTDGKPIRASMGCATVEHTWDDAGNVTERRCLGTAGEPVRSEDGYATQRMQYDRRGQVSEERYFDEQGRPVRANAGYFGFATKRDERNRVIEQSYLDAGGKPALQPVLGYAGVRNTYDATGNVSAVDYLDGAGVAIAGHRAARELHTYNWRGFEVETRYVDADGAPAAGPLHGCATLKKEWDVQTMASERCFDGSGQPFNRKDGGWAAHVITLEQARPVKEEWFDAAGKPVQPKK